MHEEHLLMICWNDLTGITRLRGVPASRRQAVLDSGLGWACAGQAITPDGGIVDNRWGPMDEARQMPDEFTEVFLPESIAEPAFHMMLASAIDKDGNPWDCCPRAFCEAALARFKAETGLELLSAVEHEFGLLDERLQPYGAFTIDATRQVAVFVDALLNNASVAGLGVQTYEAEYGAQQYEISCAPVAGIAGADRIVVGREVIRETARREGHRATFSAKAAGNGMHMHFSFRDSEGRNAFYDADGVAGMSAIAESFVAGIQAHAAAITAFAAPSPVSYARLGPGHWSCGYAAVGIQNREAALRIIPGNNDEGQSQHIEFRVPDGSCNPYLVIGAIIHAGLEGIRAGLRIPGLLYCDPQTLTALQREELGASRLPESLQAALQSLQNDTQLTQHIPEALLETYLAIKRYEIQQAASMDDEALLAMYAAIY